MKATDVLKKKRGISISFTIEIPDHRPSAVRAMKRKVQEQVKNEIQIVRPDQRPMAG